MMKNIKLLGVKLIVTQMILLCIAVMIILIFSGLQGGFSAFLGGISWIIPSIYFVYRVSRPKATGDSGAWLRDIILGEGVKFLLSVVLISSIILIVKVRILTFLAGYIVTVMASILMPICSWKK